MEYSSIATTKELGAKQDERRTFYDKPNFSICPIGLLFINNHVSRTASRANGYYGLLKKSLKNGKILHIVWDNVSM
jgi:hypothetical protein